VVEVLIPKRAPCERLPGLGAPVHFEKKETLKKILLGRLLMNAHKPIGLDEYASALIGTGRDGLRCPKLVEKRPGEKLDKLVVWCGFDGARERGFDIEQRIKEEEPALAISPFHDVLADEVFEELRPMSQGKRSAGEEPAIAA
jgi:hypothetical protein